MPKTKKPTLAQIEAERAEWRKRAEAARKATLNDLKRNIVPQLTKRGITRVQVDYSGYGDSGAIDSVDYFDAKGKSLDTDTEDFGIKPAIERIADSLLPSGFENSEGGQGHLVIDIPSRRITLEHQDNYIETHNSTKEFSF